MTVDREPNFPWGPVLLAFLVVVALLAYTDWVERVCVERGGVLVEQRIGFACVQPMKEHP